MRADIWIQLAQWLRGHFVARGEKAIVSTGAAAVAVLLAAMGANGWWMLATARESDAEMRVARIRTVGTVLSRSAETMLAGGDLTALRRLVVDTARGCQLDCCRIVLGPGQVLADANPSRINVRLLPEKWNSGPLETTHSAAADGVIAISYPISVRGKGTVSLELATSESSPWIALWRAQAGIALIGAASLGVLLLVYRRNRGQLIAVEAVQDALRSFAAGESTTAALAVDARFGPLAEAWNKLLAELDELRRQGALARVNHTSHDQRTGLNTLEAACDTMSQGLILVDAQLRIRFANGAASVFLNAPREQLIGRPIVELIGEEKIRQGVESVALQRSRKPLMIELEQQGDSNGVLRFSIRPTRKGDADAATIVIEDITQQRTAERARNSFITQVTHELRAPLTNIRLYAETAIEDGESNPTKRSECLNVINQESRRLERIVSEMLSVAEIEAGSFSIHKDDVHLDVLFKELQSDYQAQADAKKIKLEFVMPPKLPVLQADRDKLALAIHNLVGNALKYTPEGGSVTVGADVRDGQVVVDVADSGIGIREDELEKVFERFTRSKDPRVTKIVGTGLGLPLAREVMRLHGGDVTVESKLDRGSTFTATLPVTAKAA